MAAQFGPVASIETSDEDFAFVTFRDAASARAATDSGTATLHDGTRAPPPPSPARSSAGGAHAPLALALFRGAAPPPSISRREHERAVLRRRAATLFLRSSSEISVPDRRGGGGAASEQVSRPSVDGAATREYASWAPDEGGAAVALPRAQACAGVPRSRDGTQPEPLRALDRMLVEASRGRSLRSGGRRCGGCGPERRPRARPGARAGSGSGEGDPGCPSAGASGHARLLDGWVVRARDSRVVGE